MMVNKAKEGLCRAPASSELKLRIQGFKREEADDDIPHNPLASPLLDDGPRELL
jgi:hypothetical protein